MHVKVGDKLTFWPGGKTAGRSHRAASLRSRATTTNPAFVAGYGGEPQRKKKRRAQR